MTKSEVYASVLLGTSLLMPLITKQINEMKQDESAKV
jgi:hypothetical protein